MRDADIAEVTRALTTLLLTERGLLLTGRAEQAVGLAAEKLGLLERLEQLVTRAVPGRLRPDDLRAVEAVKAAAAENGLHFDAVRNGVQALLTRIAGLGADQSVGAYDRHGGKLPFQCGAGHYSRRV